MLSEVNLILFTVQYILSRDNYVWLRDQIIILVAHYYGSRLGGGQSGYDILFVLYYYIL